jgi:hypothetical protein
MTQPAAQPPVTPEEGIDDFRQGIQRVLTLIFDRVPRAEMSPEQITDDLTDACSDELDRLYTLASQADRVLPDGLTAHTCVTAKCAACGYDHGEDEGITAHFPSQADAYSILRGFDWTVLADGRVICPSGGADHDDLKKAVGLAPTA